VRDRGHSLYPLGRASLGPTSHRSAALDDRPVGAPPAQASGPATRWDIPRDHGLDGVDLVVGRAARDAAFRRRLLVDPAGALVLADIPLPLKRRLIAIRARNLGDFALQALLAEASVTVPSPARRASGPAGDGVA